jgi:hypothetical protein
MTPARFHRTLLRPGLLELARVIDIPASMTAERLLLAIALQETGLAHRYQLSIGMYAGPARGWWQFERGGGVRGVMRHAASAKRARDLCDYCAVRFEERPIWRALEGHDLLALGFARLLMWTDPYRLPTDQRSAWTMYARRLWRPGKPHPQTWAGHWTTATNTIEASS